MCERHLSAAISRALVGFLVIGFSLNSGGTAVRADVGSNRAKQEQERAAALEKDVTQGALRIIDKQGRVVECPLKHTDVQADVAGFIARVKVTQTFANPTQEKIEAVYVFPLPHEAAVDQMTMVIGSRRIVGLIKRRAEARQIYEQALLAGQTASLLEQERPNIFTQSVGNIPPGQEVKIEIAYVDVLRYDVGSYEFHFPMVVGPRYNPGVPIASPTPTPKELQGKVSPPEPDTNVVPDASRISPPVLKPGIRNGHDVSLSVKLDAGVPIQNLAVANHRADVTKQGERQATITLSKEDSLPNKDFVLRYDVTGQKPEMAVLAHTGRHSGDSRRLGEGYFLLMIQPKDDERLTKSPPREIVFLCDVSGSMSGAPTQKVIKAMQHMLKLCRAQDTVQVITFANMAQKLFERPVPVQEESIKRALNFTQGLQGGGGTEMLKGVQMAIDEPLDKERVRIVVMLTDGYIGNEAQIIEHVGKHCGDQVRFWAIGIGSSPNMFLIDGVAKQGGGMGKKLGLEDDSAALTQEVMTRIQRAQLSKVKIDWGTHHIAETYPAKIPELWAGQPVIVFGRYTGGSAGRIAISGNVEGQEVSWPLDVQLPAADPQHDVLAKVWARQKIETLMQSSHYQGSPAVEEEVTSLALDYQLMSQYTSFVAVDAQEAGKAEPSARPPRRMLVPVPLPEGTRWEGFFGPAGAERDEDLLETLGTTYKAKSESRLTLGKEAQSGGFRYALPSSGPAPSRLAAAAPTAAAGMTMRGPPPANASKSKFRRQPVAQPSVGGGVRGKNLPDSAPSGLGYTPATRADRPIHALAFSADGKSLDIFDEERSVTLWGAAFGAWVPDVSTLSKDAQQAFQQGQQAWMDDKLSDARSALTRAYLFDTAVMNASGSDGNLAALALGRLEQVHRQELTTWAKEVPALDKRLDLVVRDRSVTEALAAVAQATGLTVKLTPGSVGDAAALQGGESPRVSFLDLRGATAAQAFDWILQPVRLAWWTDKGDIVAGSQRRREGVSAWVYDVSTIAWPTTAEIGKVPDRQPPRDTARKATDEFLAAVRSQLKTSGQQVVVWFAPGQLVVIGDADLQTRAGQLFTDLADARFQPQGQLAKLHAVTSVRAKERLGEVEQQRAARRLQEVRAAHRQYGWRLLAAASDGKSDPETVTELQLAWSRAETDRLLAGEGAGLALRSLWLIREASRALPDEAELQQLAAAALGKSRSAIDAAVLALKKNPKDLDALARVLYAALAMPDDGQLRGSASTLLTGAAPKGSPLAAARTVAGALLQESSKIDRAALAQLVSAGVAGEDLVVLTALACRRAGGDTWQKFRAESRDVLTNNALSGDVVVLISRLTNAPLPMLAAK